MGLRKKRVHVPCPSAAGAAAASASGFLLHCCPGWQTLRFLPASEAHTEENDGEGPWKEVKWCLVAGTTLHTTVWLAGKMEKPAVGSG